jgi:hypothetical protein
MIDKRQEKEMLKQFFGLTDDEIDYDEASGGDMIMIPQRKWSH